MATITNRQDFKTYCLRRLGFPVIDINVDDDQVEDRIDDALQFWQDYHFDGLQKFYYIRRLSNSILVTNLPVTGFIANAVKLYGATSGATATVTTVAADTVTLTVVSGPISFQAGEALQYYDVNGNLHNANVGVASFTMGDVDQQYLDFSNITDKQNQSLNIVGVTRIFPIQDSQATINMFDLRYQLRLNELYDFTSASYINFTLTQQHLRSLELMFTGEVPIRFQRHMQRLYIDWNWGHSEAPVGTTVIAECYAVIDPDVYTQAWNDRWLKEYATALIKRSWGNNLKKFSNIQLPGGVMLNGDKIYQEAENEIKELHDQMETQYGAPLEFFLN